MQNWIHIIPALILEYLLIAYKQLEPIFKPQPSIKWQNCHKGTIILIQGLHESWTFLESIGNHFNQKGYKILTIPQIKTNTIPTLEAVKICKRFIEKQNLINLIIIAHSKGGIVARYLLQDLTIANRIDKVISIATPYKGSRLVAILPNAHDLSPDSPTIKTIQIPLSGENKTYNFYPIFDNHIIPNDSLILPSIHNHKINIVGHTRILEANQTLESIRKILQNRF